MARCRRAARAPTPYRAFIVLLAAAWCGGQGASAGTAPPGAILAPEASEVLVAGSSHVVRWSPLPAGVEEFEVLLSLDGGSSYPIRLTPQLDPAAGAYLWRVPDLPTRAARVRLRWGIAGRELEGPPGETFTIDARSWRTVSGLAWRGGEWWLTPHPSLVGLRPEASRWRGDLLPAAPPRPQLAPTHPTRWDPFPTAGPDRSAPPSGERLDPPARVRSGARRPVSFPMRC